MQNLIPKFERSSIISEKTHYLSEKLKLKNWQSLTTIEYNVFAEILHRFPT